MPNRTCSDPEGCDRKAVSRGLCSMHWKRTYGKRTKYPIVCTICGTDWLSDRREGKYCSDACKGEHYRQTRRTRCKLPAGHPVIVQMKADAEAQRLARKAETEASKFLWRTARQCPGCACWFTPLHTPNAICCSRRCSKKVGRQRRRAREHNARGEFTWSEFMRIARKFDYCCAYCGIKPERLDPDHVVPLSRGGTNTPSNLLPTCADCNSSKCAMTLPEWELWRYRRGLPARVTSWTAGDQRFVHLTDAGLVATAA